MLPILSDIHCGMFSADFMPHGHCYFWRPEIVWSHAISDAIIAISYFLIPYGLIQLIRKRPELKYKNLFLLFGLFIVACGTTHILSIINIWTPLYRLDAVVKIITALASLPTAIILLRILPEAVKIPSIGAWEEINKHLQEQIESLKEKDKTIEKVKEFEFLSNSIPQIIWTAKPNGKSDYYNEHWFSYTGLTYEETVNDGWKNVLHPDDIEKAFSAWTESYTKGIKYEIEYRFKRASDGEYRWHLGRGIPMKDENGTVIKWFGTCTDIHDFKTAQDLLTQVNSHLYSVLYSAPIIIWSVDLNGLYTMSEGKALENVGLKPGEVVGKLCYDYLKEMPLWIHNINAALKGKEFIETNTFGPSTFETSFGPLRNTSGSIIGMVGISVDVTKRKQAESESQFKTRFLAGMSHELRTPLNAVLGFASILRKTDLSENQRKYVSLINQSGEMLLKLIGNVLDISKIEEGKLEIENENFKLKDAIESALHPYKFQANNKGLDFNIIFDDKTPDYVYGDKLRICQVLINLIGNAIKFTQKGKIQVRIDQLGINNNEVTLKFSVADSGKGIQKEEQLAVFESFTQANTGISKEYGGSGLGLSIVKQMVGLMGGEIYVDSPHNYFSSPIGTCFWFNLKLNLGQAPDEDSTPSEFHVFDPMIRGLVAEDNEVNQIVARLVLEAIGCKVEFANNGEECIAMLKKDKYDFVLMDIQMPVLNGIDATIEIRKNISKEIPIIGLSANVSRNDIKMSLDSGMNDHVGKPYSEQQIYNAISKWVSAPSNKIQRITTLEYLIALTKDKEDLIGMLSKILFQVKDFYQKMVLSIEKKDWQELNFTAHTYKSSARLVGATRLQLALGELEELAHIEAENEIYRQFEKISELNPVVISELEAELKSLKQASTDN